MSSISVAFFETSIMLIKIQSLNFKLLLPRVKIFNNSGQQRKHQPVPMTSLHLMIIFHNVNIYLFGRSLLAHFEMKVKNKIQSQSTKNECDLFMTLSKLFIK